MRWTGFGSRSIVEIITRYPLLLLLSPTSEEVEGDSNVRVGREAAEAECENSLVCLEDPTKLDLHNEWTHRHEMMKPEV